MSKKGTITSIIIILAVLFFLCICCVTFFVMASAISDYELDSNITEEVIVEGESSDEIALIDIEGMIASSTDTLDGGDQDMVDIIVAKLEKAQSIIELKKLEAK